MLCAWSITPIQPAAALCVCRPNIDLRPSPSPSLSLSLCCTQQDEIVRKRMKRWERMEMRVVVSNWEKQKGIQRRDVKADFRNKSAKWKKTEWKLKTNNSWQSSGRISTNYSSNWIQGIILLLPDAQLYVKYNLLDNRQSFCWEFLEVQ